MSKKHCMFQCSLQKVSILGYVQNQYEFVENTDLITWQEAVDLWEKYKQRVIDQLMDKQSPEMTIWTACADNTSYSNDAFHVNYSTIVRNGKFVEVIEREIDPTTVTMGEPV